MKFKYEYKWNKNKLKWINNNEIEQIWKLWKKINMNININMIIKK